MRLLAFGGPINERVIDVETSNDIVLFNTPATPAPAEDMHPTSATFPRTITYRVERVGYHFTDRCIDPNIGHHSATCRWTAKCLVGEGYPKHRITDALDAIVGMTRVLQH